MHILLAEVVIAASNDPRSYRFNSDKLLATGFVPAFGVFDASAEVRAAHADGSLRDDDRSHNVRWMSKVNLDAARVTQLQ